MKLINPTNSIITFGKYYVHPSEVIELSVEEIKNDKNAQFLFDRLVVVDDRSEASKRMDKRKTSSKVLDKTPENVELWHEEPNKYDLKGVDTNG